MPEPITPDTDPDLIRALARACSIAEGSASEERLAALEGRERRLATEALDRLTARVATLRAALREPAEDPDPAVVKLAAAALADVTPACAECDARAVLSALAAAGQLPVDTEWTVQTPGGITLPPGYTEQTARERAAEIGGTAVMRRVCPWQPVPQPAEETPGAARP